MKDIKIPMCSKCHMNQNSKDARENFAEGVYENLRWFFIFWQKCLSVRLCLESKVDVWIRAFFQIFWVMQQQHASLQMFIMKYSNRKPLPRKNWVHRKTLICANIHNIAFIPARQCNYANSMIKGQTSVSEIIWRHCEVRMCRQKTKL